MYAEKKWETSLAKTHFAKSFPGLIASATGKQIESEISLNAGSSLIRFTDGTFTLKPYEEHDIPKFLAALRASEHHLPEEMKPHFDTLRRLTEEDREMGRLSRMEKLLGAIVNNTPLIPELPEAVAKWLNKEAYQPPETMPEKIRVQLQRIHFALEENITEIPELLEEVPKVLDGSSTLIQCDVMKAAMKKI
ncbi:MAG: hypothetical protein SFU91_13930 [Chloroherpetonaceae bacterium]|nr:hypothetical protein [Chloroherpetonaceae bacterium]